MAHSIRIDNLQEFNPEPSKWRHDRRNYDQATDALEVLVAKNYSKLGLPCVAIYPDMDKKRKEFVGFKVAVPDGPLKHYFEQEETKKIFFDLFRDACIDAVAKKERKRSGEIVQSSSSIVKVIGFVKPPRPLWTLSLKELETYFSILKSKLAAYDGVKLKPKWPKLVDGKPTSLPTPIPSMDEVTERILPSSLYVPCQKFPLGNLHWRLKLVCAYIFLKFNENPDTFAQEIPDNFRAKEFCLKDLEKFSNNLDKSAEEHHEPKRKKKVVVEEIHVPFYAQDDVDYEKSDSEEENQEFINPSGTSTLSEPAVDGSSSIRSPPSPSRSSARPPPGPSGSGQSSGQSCSRTLPILSRPQKSSQPTRSHLERNIPENVTVTMPAPKDVFCDIDDLELLNTSHQTGTPDNSGEDEHLMARLEAEINDGERYLKMKMMEKTNIQRKKNIGST